MRKTPRTGFSFTVCFTRQLRREIIGFGDWLMASGEAHKLHKQTGNPVLICNAAGVPQWSEVFEGVPYILRRPPRGVPYQKLRNAPGLRPYIAGKTNEKWTWRPYKPIPAQLVFNAAELAFAEPYRGLVMLEPSVKKIGHENKDWGPINWSQLDSALWLAGVKTVQCGPPGTRFLRHVKQVTTPSFRMAAAVLSVARAFVGTEGGLMHAAAAVGTPSVIIWSEFISPEITGYKQHVNLREAGKPCGMRIDCESCRRSLTAITPTKVFEALKGILK